MFVFHLSVVTGNRYGEIPPTDIKFPMPADLVNYTVGSKDFSKIAIPPSLVQERMDQMRDNGKNMNILGFSIVPCNSTPLIVHAKKMMQLVVNYGENLICVENISRQY